MSDMAKRDAVLQRYVLPGRLLTFSSGGPLIEQNRSDVDAMADRIVELEAAVERVRALHTIKHPKRARWCRRCKEAVYPCPTLRALEGIS